MKSLRRRRTVLFGLLFGAVIVLTTFSFRAIRDERLLLERAQEARYAAFADAVEQQLRSTRQALMDRLRLDLAAGGGAESPLAAWELAARLLENPLVHSVAVFRNEDLVFPPLASEPSRARLDSLAVEPEPPRLLERAARAEWRAGRPAGTLRAVRLLLHGPDSLPATAAETRLGYRLLELKSLVLLGESDAAVAVARALVRDLLATPDLESHHRTGFYLSEIAAIMTARENLPRDARSDFFALHERLPAFLANADAISRDWGAPPLEILRAQPPGTGDSLRIQYHAGAPYLLVRFPWLESDAQALLRLSEEAFAEALRTELMDRRSAWRDMDFTLYDTRDSAAVSGNGGAEQAPALERSFEDQFPAWRLVVYQRPADELEAQRRWGSLLQYAILLLSLGILGAGAWFIPRALNDADRLVSMKDNFLSAVSHELRTPLTAIRMFSEMLASGRVPGEKGAQYAGRIGAEAERLQAMIEGILTFTRLEEDPRALAFEEADLARAARESAALFTEAYARAGIRLEQRLPEQAPLRGDHNALRSVVQNLLENALKYSPADTTVTLEVLARNEDIVLRVADQGIGISSADQKRIFDKFYRAGDEMTRKARGSGLGLALVKRIADAHGAQIRVQSRPGEGTEMTIVFPKTPGRKKPGKG